MKKFTTLLLLLGFAFAGAAADTNATDWLTRPLSSKAKKTSPLASKVMKK